jgi:predicted ATPase
VSFSRELRDVYQRSGYTLVDVPRDSIADRATFVRMSIARFGATGTKGGT